MFGVYFFKGNGQVVPATRSNYLPVAVGISNQTDAHSVMEAFRGLFPQRHWIVTSDFKLVFYGFRDVHGKEIV